MTARILRKTSAETSFYEIYPNNFLSVVHDKVMAHFFSFPLNELRYELASFGVNDLVVNATLNTIN